MFAAEVRFAAEVETLNCYQMFAAEAASMGSEAAMGFTGRSYLQ